MTIDRTLGTFARRWTASRPRLALLLAALALVSVVYQGFDYGVINNATQVLILKHAAHPELYPGNPFVAALDNYCSAVWWILKQFRGVNNWAAPFFALHYFARLLFVYVMFLFLRRMTGGGARAFAGVVMLVFADVLWWYSPIARSDLLIPYFNHTEIAFGAIMAALYCSLAGRPWAAMALGGVAFNCNAFFAAWGLAGQMTLQQWRERALPLAHQARRRAPMLAIFFAVSLPTIIWIVIALRGRQGYAPFDYRTFLAGYWPYHYFIVKAQPAAILNFTAIVFSGYLALAFLPRERLRAPLALLFSTCLGLFCVGAAAPFFTARSIVLDLQFMRIDSFLTIFAALATIAACLERLAPSDPGARATPEAALPLMGLILGSWLAVWASLAIVLSRGAGRGKRWALCAMLIAAGAALRYCGPPPIDGHPRGLVPYTAGALLVALALLVARARANPYLALCFFVLVVECILQRPMVPELALLMIGVMIAVPIGDRAALPGRIIPAAALVLTLTLAPGVGGFLGVRAVRRTLSNMSGQQRDFQLVCAWARANTPIDTMFMNRTVNHEFSIFSERSAWQNLKMAEAVICEPRLYWTWIERKQAQEKLRTPEEILAYARANKIAYLIDYHDGAQPPELALPVAYKSQGFIVYDLN